VAATGLVALSPMISRGHSEEFTCGLICAGAGMAATLPPSILMLIYAPVAGVSVDRLFMASLIPSGILLALYLIYTIVRSGAKMPAPVRALERRESPSGDNARKVLTYVIPTMLVILAVIGSMFCGIARPLEAGGLGVTGVLMLAVLHRKMNLATLKSSLLHSLKVTSLVLWVVLGASLFSGVFIKLGGDRVAHQLVSCIGGGPWVTLSAMILIIVLMGTFVECVGTILVLAPFYLPILKALSFNEIWFGVLFCLALGTAHFTPPVSVALVILKGVAPKEIPLTTMYRGVTPYLLIQFLAMGIVTCFPQTALFLPGLMAD
jgi:tripartite ATP-independent transporter DctM subunit